MDVFDLFAKLSLDSSEYEKGLSDAESKGSNFGKGLGTAAKIGVGAVAAVGTAAVAAGTALVKNTGEVAEYGDSIDKMSQKVGMSAEAYQEWDYVMQISGTEMSSMTTGLKTLTNKFDDAVNGSDKAVETFDRLGLSMEDIQGLSREDLFAKVITQFQGMEDSAERAALANDLFGRSGQELAPLFNTTSEETQRLIQEVNDLGGVMSDESVKASASYQDQLTALTTSFTGLKNNLVSDFLPSVTDVMGGLTEIFSGNYDEGVNKISEGINNVITNITNSLPKLIEVGGSIIEALFDAIMNNLPKIIDAAIQIILKLVDGLIQALPQLAEGAVQIIVALAEGIGEALPQLIPAIVDAVLAIVQALIDNVDLLIDGAIALMLGLAEGLIQALPVLIEKAPEIVIKLVEAIIMNAPKLLQAAIELIITLVDGMVKSFGKLIEVGADLVQQVKDGFLQKVQDAKNWGRDMIQNFIDGIMEKWNHLKDTVSDVAQTVKDFLGFSEPKYGPLSNFHTYAPDMMDLFIDGIKDGEKALQDQISETFSFNPVVNAQRSSEQSIVDGNMKPVNVSVYLEGDAQGIFRVVRTENDIFTKANGISAFA